jgi:hypothetical protein
LIKKTASVTPIATNKKLTIQIQLLQGSKWFLTADNVMASYTRTTLETIAGSSYTISATLAPIVVLNNYNITYNTAKFIITDTTSCNCRFTTNFNDRLYCYSSFAVAMATDACGSTFTLTLLM